MNDLFDVHFIVSNKEAPFRDENVVHKWKESNLSYNYDSANAR